MSSFKSESSVKTVDCGECSYCMRKCSCPGCNGYPNWGGCGGCRDPIPQPPPLRRHPHVEPEIFIPHGGPEGVGVEPNSDCLWDACGVTKYTENTPEEDEEKKFWEELQKKCSGINCNVFLCALNTISMICGHKLCSDCFQKSDDTGCLICNDMRA